MKKVLSLILFCIPFWVSCQSINVIPKPQEVVMTDGKLPLWYGLKITDGNGQQTQHPSDSLYIYPSPHGAFFTVNALFDNNIHSIPYVLVLLNIKNPALGIEGYHIEIKRDTIRIEANTLTGIRYGTNTINQILNWKRRMDSIPCCDITDYPSYPYRAMHLDVCRHFFSKDFIKKYIDQLAYYKINTLHWHLTDDQGWRIEIKKYPKLTEVGSWRTEKDGTKYGGYYTQDDIKEIVAYAADRFITIVPEIEMPGHSSAALAAYPYLGCTGNQIAVPNTWGIKTDIYAPTDTVFRFFQDVMDEVCAFFPGRYIHIGGDEAPKAQWKSSPLAQAVMKQNNLKNEEELQHYFMHRVEKYLNSKGKTAIGWGEVVKGGLSDSIVVMSWLSKGAGIKAVRHGNNVIMAPRGYCYFDYPQGGDAPKAFWMLPLPLKKVYSFNPIPGGLLPNQQKHILGGEATLWTEYVTTEAQAMHQLFPRLAAMSEALWTKPKNKNFKDFEKRLKVLTTNHKP